MRAVLALTPFLPVAVTAQNTAPVVAAATVHAQRLPNGFTYYLSQPVQAGGETELRLVVRAGSAYETDAERGAAFAASQLALQGTPKFPGDSLRAYLQFLASDLGADTSVPTVSTSYGVTMYRLNVTSDSDAVARALTLVADWAHGVSPSQRALDDVRPAILTGLTAAEARAPGVALTDAAVLAGTPYATHPPFGSKAVLGALSAESVQQFVRAVYRPDNMALVVVSDLPADQVRQLIATHLGALAGASGALRTLPAYTTPATVPVAASVVTDPDSANAWVRVVLRRASTPVTSGIPLNTEAVRDSLLSQLYTEILTHRLAGLSVAQGSPVYGARASLGWSPIDGLRLVCEAGVRGSKSGKVTRVQIDSVVRILASELVSPAQQSFTKAEVDFYIANYAVYSSFTTAMSNPVVREAQQYVTDYLTGTAPGVDVSTRVELLNKLRDGLTPAVLRDIAQSWNAARRDIVVGLPRGTTTEIIAPAAVVATATAAAQRQFPPVALDERALRIVTLEPVAGKSLTQLLAAEAAKADRLGFTPIVEFGAVWCGVCHVLDKGLETPSLRHAFERIYLIRLDLDKWKDSLPEAGFQVTKVPVMFALTRSGRPSATQQLGTVPKVPASGRMPLGTEYAGMPAVIFDQFVSKCRSEFAGAGAGKEKTGQAGE